MHRCVYLFMVLLCFTLCYPLLYFSKHGKNAYIRLVRWRRRIALMGSYLSGIFYKVHRHVEIDWSRTYLICSNHSSNMDITAIMYACKNDFSFMGKAELLDNPVTGFFFRTVDIPVNRSSKISAFRAFKKAQDCLEQKKSIVIFPEGLISDTFPPKLSPFKNGAFKLALDLKIPILPIVIENAWKVYWDDGKARGSRPGCIHIQVLPPVETKDFQGDSDSLRDHIYADISNIWMQRNNSELLDSK